MSLTNDFLWVYIIISIGMYGTCLVIFKSRVFTCHVEVGFSSLMSLCMSFWGGFHVRHVGFHECHVEVSQFLCIHMSVCNIVWYWFSNWIDFIIMWLYWPYSSKAFHHICTKAEINNIDGRLLSFGFKNLRLEWYCSFQILKH